MGDQERREFANSETMRLGLFLNVDPKLLIGWHREYCCGCGFSCTKPRAIYDHAQQCARVGK